MSSLTLESRLLASLKSSLKERERVFSQNHNRKPTHADILLDSKWTDESRRYKKLKDNVQGKSGKLAIPHSQSLLTLGTMGTQRSAGRAGMMPVSTTQTTTTQGEGGTLHLGAAGLMPSTRRLTEAYTTKTQRQRQNQAAGHTPKKGDDGRCESEVTHVSRTPVKQTKGTSRTAAEATSLPLPARVGTSPGAALTPGRRLWQAAQSAGFATGALHVRGAGQRLGASPAPVVRGAAKESWRAFTASCFVSTQQTQQDSCRTFLGGRRALFMNEEDGEEDANAAAAAAEAALQCAPHNDDVTVDPLPALAGDGDRLEDLDECKSEDDDDDDDDGDDDESEDDFNADEDADADAPSGDENEAPHMEHCAAPPTQPTTQPPLSPRSLAASQHAPQRLTQSSQARPAFMGGAANALVPSAVPVPSKPSGGNKARSTDGRDNFVATGVQRGGFGGGRKGGYAGGRKFVGNRHSNQAKQNTKRHRRLARYPVRNQERMTRKADEERGRKLREEAAAGAGACADGVEVVDVAMDEDKDAVVDEEGGRQDPMNCSDIDIDSEDDAMLLNPALRHSKKRASTAIAAASIKPAPKRARKTTQRSGAEDAAAAPPPPPPPPPPLSLPPPTSATVHPAQATGKGATRRTRTNAKTSVVIDSSEVDAASLAVRDAAMKCSLSWKATEEGPETADLDAALLELLRTGFAHTCFRTGQLASVRRLCLLASSDVPSAEVHAHSEQQHQQRGFLTVLPTGCGKTLVYAMAAAAGPHAVVVVSPLVALMRDQVDRLPSHLRAAAVDSATSTSKALDVLASLVTEAEGVSASPRIVFISPERFSDVRATRALCRGAAEGRRVLVVVDEAHVVTSWGSGFRPCYLRISSALTTMRSRGALAGCAGFTATVPAAQHRALCSMLSLDDALTVTAIPCDGGAEQAHPIRDNLRLSVYRGSRKTNGASASAASAPNFSLYGAQGRRGDDARSVSDFLKGRKARWELDGKKAPFRCLVYAPFRNDVDVLCASIVGCGVPAHAYHAGKNQAERARSARAFDECRTGFIVLVATSAFGMGLDVQDCSLVVHYGPPRSLEEYAQMVGRGARGGGASSAECVLFLRDEKADETQDVTASLTQVLRSQCFGGAAGSTACAALAQSLRGRRKGEFVSFAITSDADDRSARRRRGRAGDALAVAVPRDARSVASPLPNTSNDSLETLLSYLESGAPCLKLPDDGVQLGGWLTFIGSHRPLLASLSVLDPKEEQRLSDAASSAKAAADLIAASGQSGLEGGDQITSDTIALAIFKLQPRIPRERVSRGCREVACTDLANFLGIPVEAVYRAIHASAGARSRARGATRPRYVLDVTPDSLCMIVRIEKDVPDSETRALASRLESASHSSCLADAARFDRAMDAFTRAADAADADGEAILRSEIASYFAQDAAAPVADPPPHPSKAIAASMKGDVYGLIRSHKSLGPDAMAIAKYLHGLSGGSDSLFDAAGGRQGAHWQRYQRIAFEYVLDAASMVVSAEAARRTRVAADSAAQV